MANLGQELEWLSNLYGSDFSNEKKSEGGTKGDFHRLNKIAYHDKTFDKWFKSMVEKEVIYKSEQKRHKGTIVDTYLANKEKVRLLIKQNRIFNISVRYFTKHDFLHNPNEYLRD